MKKKRHLKKKVKVILFIICIIISLLILSLFTNKSSSNNKKKKVKEPLVTIKNSIESEYYEYMNYTDGDYLYYYDSGDRFLAKINIKDNKIDKIRETPDSYCYSISNEYIKCDNNTFISVTGEEVVNKYPRNDVFSTIVTNKKDIIVSTDNEIYINNEMVLSLTGKYNSYSIIGYYNNKNSYNLLLTDYTDIIEYDINKNKEIKRIKYDYLENFHDGIAFKEVGESTKYYIYLYNGKKLEYTIPTIKNDGDYVEKIFDKGNKLFLLDKNIYNGYIIDLKNKSFKQFNLDNSYDYSIPIDIYKDKIYLLSNKGEKEYIHIININSIDDKDISFKDYDKKINKENEQIIKSLEDKGLHIYTGKKALTEYLDFSAEQINSIYLNNIALKKLDKVLEKYPKEMLDYFNKGYKGLHIYIVKNFVDHIRIGFAADAYTYSQDNKTYLVINGLSTCFEQSFDHEMEHSFEYMLQDTSGEYFNEWYKINPDNFSYMYDYQSDNNTEKYTKDNDGKNAYFVEIYSKVNEMEDRATLFKEICGDDSEIKLSDYKYLKIKFDELKRIFIHHMPESKEFKCFKEN